MKIALIAVLIVLANVAAIAYAQRQGAPTLAPPTQAPVPPVGRFSIVATEGIAWRLDTVTGGIVACLTTMGNASGVTRKGGCDVAIP